MLALVLCLGVPPRDTAEAVYAEVRAALDAKSLRVVTVNDCKSELSIFTTGTDARTVIRYLLREYGTKDSSQRAEAYYDERGKLRLVFVRVGAVPSAWIEARYWLDETGKIADHKRATGGEGVVLRA